MLTAVNACAAACSLLLVVWIGLQVVARGRSPTVDRLGAVCYLALGATSVVVFRTLVLAAPEERGPLPVFVFLGAPMGLGLAWLSWRQARSS